MHQSQGAYNPRAFESFWTPFVRFSQVFCVSHYSTFYRNERVGRIIYFIIFSVLHISLMVYTLLNGLHIQMKPSNKYKTSPLMFYVNFVSVAGNFVTHTVAHLEPFFSRKDEREIYRRLNEINEIFALKLNYVTDFDAIKKKFVRGTMAFFVFTATFSFGYSFFSLPTNDNTIFLFLLNRALAVVVIRTRRIQAAFLINSLSNILIDLQLLLKRQQEDNRQHSTNRSSSSKNIQYLRDIYSNVWLIKNLISNCFGWSFITFLFEFSFDLINSSYWTYINIKIYTSKNMIIRNIFFSTVVHHFLSIHSFDFIF